VKPLVGISKFDP